MLVAKCVCVFVLFGAFVHVSLDISPEFDSGVWLSLLEQLVIFWFHRWVIYEALLVCNSLNHIGSTIHKCSHVSIPETRKPGFQHLSKAVCQGASQDLLTVHWCHTLLSLQPWDTQLLITVNRVCLPFLNALKKTKTIEPSPHLNHQSRLWMFTPWRYPPG